MKKTLLALSTLLLIALLAVGLIFSASADDTVHSGTWGDLTWTLNETTGELVISGEGEMRMFERPSSTDAWRAYKSQIKSVVIEEGVTNVGYYAFRECANLERITIPDSVTSVDYYPFLGCTKLIQIENGVSYVNGWVIACDASATSVTLRPGTVGIAKGAFDGGTNLVSLTALDGLKYINSHAFSNCETLVRVSLPNSVVSIGINAFEYCTSLTSINIPTGLTAIPDHMLYNCNNLSQITIPSGVKTIGNGAFASCDMIDNVVIPEGVTSIGDSAFYYCTSLKTVTIPKSVKSFGVSTFLLSSNLTSIVYGGSPAEWEAITKGDRWDTDTGNYKITYTVSHSFPDGKDKCSICGGFRDGIAALYGYSISLNGDISINFYFEVSEETKQDANAYILIAYPNGSTEKILLSEARTKTAGGVTYYVINPTLPAKEINSIVSARIVRGDGTEGILYEKSIRGYAETLIENADSYSPEQVALMEALIAYGEAASVHFGGGMADPQLTEITAETLADYAMAQSGTPNTGLTYFGSSVLLESETTIRHYFRLTSGSISDHTFLIDGKAVMPVNEAGTNYWYVDIPNIVSKDLDRVYTVEADGMTLEYSVLSYAYTALLKYSDDPFSVPVCNTVKALYEYNLAANAYFE
ncbi:MAG: leucine-rich repeat protein [Clostridia bacterium]|nr:leucine-rich repeat protein [Clostridia bacterium]